MYYICKSLKKVDMFKRGKFTVLLAVLVVLFQLVSISQNSITGIVTYHNDPSQPMPGVEVTLCDLNGEAIETQFTNEGGKYMFDNLIEDEYLLKSSYDQPLGFNIDLSDILMLLDYLNGNITLEPIQLLAADVDGNGAVDYNDFDVIVNTYYLQQQSYPVGDWVFSEKYVIPGYKDGGNVGGTVAGDLSGNNKPDKSGSSTIDFYIEQNAIEIFSGEIFDYKATIQSNSNITASLYLLLNFNSDLLSVNSIESDIEGFEYFIEEDEIRIIWIDKSLNGINYSELSNLFSIKMQLIDPNCKNASNLISINNRSCIVDANGNPIYGSHISFPTLLINNLNEVEVRTYPNPCVESTYFEFNLKSDGIATLFITDMQGQIVQHYFNNEMYSKGKNTIRINKNNLKPGAYLYNFNFLGEESMHKTGKILFVE
jgi:hypothetical protein